MGLRELFRFWVIIRTLCKYGVDDAIPRRFWPWPMRLWRHSLFFWPNRHKNLPLGERLRLALESLGPVFIKLGQMLSTRRDLLPADIADALALLQDQVTPFAGEEAKKRIEKSLRKPLDAIFSEFDIEPLASASIAQVHCARLKSNDREVVVKVIRPGIAHVIDSDIRLMRRFAKLLMWIPDARRLRPVEVIEEYRRTLLGELDLIREAANAIQLRRNFEGSKLLYIPEVYSELCHTNVLVMERIYGIPVSDVAQLKAQGTDMKLLAERGVEVFFTQVFRDSFFHADMHPGNVFVSREHPESPKYIGIDCGIVGTLNREDQRYLAENFLAFFNRDYRMVAQLHVNSGWVPADTKVEEFEAAIRTVCEPIFEKPLAEISFGHVLLNLFNTARRYHMQVQPQLVLLQKTLLYIEGLGRQLYPQLDLWATAKPFLERWMRHQVGPNALLDAIKVKAPYWAEKLPEIPELIFENLQLFRRHQQNFGELSKRYIATQRARQASLFYGICSGACLISAAVIYPNSLRIAGFVVGVALILAFCGWRRLR
ncbi:ubiquinone biosynthesis regulatory protein kinase UbiB [Celerinatantimonas sp. YJH-8]|uniref:ubiquinone biosynthesis regulatory protein kinase UbiB n=1 Tax=Celerinatantimonas sp. YJH-8 TaxID=3228714 RepID=UPI0038C93D67